MYPHQALSDAWVLDVLCRMMHLGDVREDSVNEWLAEENGTG